MVYHKRYEYTRFLTGVFLSVHRQKTCEYRRIPCVFFLARAKIRSAKTARYLLARDFVMIFAADNDGIYRYSEADNAKKRAKYSPTGLRVRVAYGILYCV